MLKEALGAVGSFLGAGGTLASGIMSSKAIERANQANRAMQYDFAKHSLGWKVKDATDAGLHPLYALGASTHSPSIPIQETGSAMGNAIAGGLDRVGRGISTIGKGLDNEKKDLQNELIRAQIKSSEASALRDVSMANKNKKEADYVMLSMKNSLQKRLQQEANHLRMPGFNFKTSKTATQQEVEDNYGDIIGEPYGLLRFSNDLLWENIYGPTLKWLRRPKTQLKYDYQMPTAP